MFRLLRTGWFGSRKALEALLERHRATERYVKQAHGFCPCCRRATTFFSTKEWLRDHYICRGCGSIPRQRHILSVLDDQFPGWESMTIHESSPSSDFVGRRASATYSSSQYLPDVPRGQTSNGVRCENIEALTFPDESIDLFITQDVLEHVFAPARALREIHRVLRPRGAHVFTAPTHPSLERSIQRAAMRDEQVCHLVTPPEYHGSPVGDGRALVTWDYGEDARGLFEEWVGAPVQYLTDSNPRYGIEAELLGVYVIRKPAPTVA